MQKNSAPSQYMPVCCCCRKIRDESGNWYEPAHYPCSKLENIQLTHGFCPDCIARFYPEMLKISEITRA